MNRDVLEAIADLRRHVDERFDSVDGRLWDLEQILAEISSDEVRQRLGLEKLRALPEFPNLLPPEER